jgi:hypothetical protein
MHEVSGEHFKHWAFLNYSQTDKNGLTASGARGVSRPWAFDR